MFPAHPIPLRSSALVHAAHEPLRYVVEDLFGISPPGAPSEAMTIGNAVHAVLEQKYGRGNPNPSVTHGRLRHALANKAVLHNCSDSTRLSWLEQFDEDWQTGQLIAEVAFTSPAFTQLLREFRPLVAEVRIYADRSLNPPARRPIIGGRGLWSSSSFAPGSERQIGGLLIQPDLLCMSQTANELWVLDAKTCDMPPRVRAATAPLEIQPVHYLHVLDSMQACGLLVPFLNAVCPGHGVNAETKVVGCLHLLIQKPGIRISKKTLKASGSEAAVAQYRERLIQWYASEGEFTHLRGEREADGPPVDFSATRYPSSTDGIMGVGHSLSWYTNTLVEASRIQTDLLRPAYSSNASEEGYLHAQLQRAERVRQFVTPPEADLRQYGKISWLLPFYRLPSREWPSIIQRERLVQQWRHHLDLTPLCARNGQPRELPSEWSAPAHWLSISRDLSREEPPTTPTLILDDTYDNPLTVTRVDHQNRTITVSPAEPSNPTDALREAVSRGVRSDNRRDV